MTPPRDRRRFVPGPRGWLVATVVCLAPVAAGCGSDDPPSNAVTTTQTVPSTPTVTAPAKETVIRTVTSLTSFRSPSGNIGCVIDRGSVRCDIDTRDWEPPAAPKGCDLDFGQGIALRSGGRPRFVCAGDTTLSSDAREIAYGEAIQAGRLRCDSDRSAMSCRDTQTGRGFTLASERYETF